MTWFVIRSATRQEKRAAASLVELFGPDAVYLPLETRWAQLGHKRERKEAALFANYLFADLARDQIWLALAADGVHNIIGIERQTETVPAGEIEALRQAQADGAFNFTREVKRVALKVGQSAKVTQGPYAGWVGRVVMAKGKNRVGLLVELFGRPRRVDLPTGDLEAA